eukprot:TRINITY_DN118_c0_g1_i5.p2 TRINITY_DN118_c0_g1~~TRINITY_DN118_c0_g1_i5.p2  ORF type:complete len:396 (+),score=160.48 TRINITY_DN118_c0_g1_i5:46-1233(+)
MANHGPVYGLDADLKAKQDSKYDSQIESETRAWVEAVTGEKITNFHEDLKDGVTLCNLMNKIRPGLVKKINKQKTPFMMMENIGFFLKGCAALGVNKVDQFMTVDLYEAKNLGQVIHCIHALGRHVSNSSSYSGPLLGTSEVPRSSSTVTSPVKASNDDAERKEAREAKEREEKERHEQEQRAERERKEAEAREIQLAKEREEQEREAHAAKEREEKERQARLEQEERERHEREAAEKQAQEKKEQEEREEREKIEREKQAQDAHAAQVAKEQEEREAILREAKAREEESERKEKELQQAKEAKEVQERLEQADSLMKQAVLVSSDQGPITQAQLQALFNRLETLESAKSQIESKLATLETESKDLKQQLHEQTEVNTELTKTVAGLNKILEDLK